jgi:hypothetical protein
MLRRFLNSRFWKFLGHVFRFKTVGDLLGWWETNAWQRAISGGVGMIAAWLPYNHVPWWLIPIVFLGSSIIMVVVFSKFMPSIRTRPTPSVGVSLAGFGIVRNPMGGGISSMLVSFIVTGEPVQVISTTVEPTLMSFEVGGDKQVLVPERELPKAIQIGLWPSRKTIIVRRFRTDCFEIDGTKSRGLEVRAYILEAGKLR